MKSDMWDALNTLQYLIIGVEQARDVLQAAYDAMPATNTHSIKTVSNLLFSAMELYEGYTVKLSRHSDFLFDLYCAGEKCTPSPVGVQNNERKAVYDGIITSATEDIPTHRPEIFVQSEILEDREIASALKYLLCEFEKRDSRLTEPHLGTSWNRDIAAVIGGGWQSYNYNVSGGTEKGLWKLFVWSNRLALPLIGQRRLQVMGSSVLDELYDRGLRLNWGKSIDINTYLGFPAIGTFGLINNPEVLASMVAPGAGGSSLWMDKTHDEILNDVSAAIVETWEESDCDIAGMANHILIPPNIYTAIATRKVDMESDKTILSYLLENNFAKTHGVEINIHPCRWCIGAGEGGADRMVGYVNNADTVHFDTSLQSKQ